MANRSSIKKNKTCNNEINRLNNSISSNSNHSSSIFINKPPVIQFISRKNEDSFDTINTNNQANDTTTDDEEKSNYKIKNQKYKIKNSSSPSSTNKKLSLKRTFFKNLKAISSSLSHSSSIENSTLANSESDFDHSKNSNNKKQRETKIIDNVKNQTSSAWSSSSSQYYNNYNNRRATLGHQQKSTSVLTVNWSNLDYDEDDFAEAFRVFDKNGDGRITDKELSQVLKELGIIISEEDIRLMIAELDKDGNGTIEYSEFVQMMTQPASREADEFELREAFKCIDLDGNGFISKEELRKAVRKIMSTDKKISVDDVETMMIEADQDGNGLIDFDEFVRILVDKRN